MSRYVHPFTAEKYWLPIQPEEDNPLGKDTPRTLIELRMCELSAAIREKPGWHIKFGDDNIRAKWRQEIEEQQADLDRGLKLTENMINYIMGELEGYAALRDTETGIEAGPYERIWKSDTLISPALKSALLQAIAPLESVPDNQKDWHPRSNNQVLDLVHPSLYPVVYGRSSDVRTGEPLAPRQNVDVPDRFKSQRFQWLPSDFDVDSGGRVTLASPYINNVHPDDHAALVEVIPQVLQRAVPLFERVLSDLQRETALPTRLDRKFPNCVWEDDDYYDTPRPGDDEEAMAEIKAETARLRDEAEARGEDVKRMELYAQLAEYAWMMRRITTWPESKPSYEGALECVRKTVNLRGTRMQVIMKLANIVLTPEKPEYEGGTWHVEGMDNESIVSTFIYYYDCENITESTLSFRNGTAQPDYHRQDDDTCMYVLYDMQRESPCVQEVGHIVTQQDRCIAFPNLYQHCVSPFNLFDTSKSGHRKILVFFLVDPHITIPSASVVGPQQAAWIRRALEDTVLWMRLPAELRDYVWAFLKPMDDGEAKEIREALMEERTAFVNVVERGRFGQLFNMCEH